MSNAHQCENPGCKAELTWDHVTLVTTKHVRRFCSVECLMRSYLTNLVGVAAMTTLEAEKIPSGRRDWA